MTDAGFLVAVMDLMGHRERDGHSGAWAMAQPSTLLHAWPIWLWDFPDGLRVVAAREPYGDLVGARLTMVGGASIEDATRDRRAARPARQRLDAARQPADLPDPPRGGRGARARPARRPGPDLRTARRIDPRGHPRAAPHARRSATGSSGAYGGDFPRALPPDRGRPALPAPPRARLLVRGDSRRRPGSTSATTRCGRTSGSQHDHRISRTLSRPPQPRTPTGRSSSTCATTAAATTTPSPRCATVEAIAARIPGRVSLITGRSTFSAAGNFVTDLKVGPEKAGIRLVGEPPGGGLNIYGDVDVVTLPASKIVVLVSGRYHERAPGDDRLAI